MIRIRPATHVLGLQTIDPIISDLQPGSSFVIFIDIITFEELKRESVILSIL